MLKLSVIKEALYKGVCGLLYSDLIFIYGFLPITILITFLDRSTEYKNLILILTSVIFFTFGRPMITLLLFSTVVFDYLFGLIAGYGREKWLRALGFFCSIVMNSSLYIVFCWNSLFKNLGIEQLTFAKKIIPICVAFYTIRGISYVGDAYKKRIKPEKNVFCLLVYMISYHFMVVGPIVRYGDIADQIRHRTITGQNLNDGLNRFIIGFAKVMILGLSFEKIKEAGLNFAELTPFGAWVGMLAFIGNIYFLFTGYTDMALGLGILNGFKYKENFSPIRLSEYVSGIVKGFNKLLVEFFEDFLVVPFKMDKVEYISGVLISGVLIGLWYGFSQNFLILGLYFALLVIIEKLFLKRILDKLPKIIGYIYTLFAVFMGAAIAYFSKLEEFLHWFKALFGIGTDYMWSVNMRNKTLSYLFLAIIGVIIMIPGFKNIIRSQIKVFAEKNEKNYAAIRISQTVCICMLLVMATAASITV